MVDRLGVGHRSGDRLQESGLASVGDLRSGQSLSSLTAHYSVKSMDGIGGVIDHTTGTIGFQKAVLPLDHISVTGLVLVLEVSSVSVLDVVGEVVLRMGIVLLRLLADDRLASIGQSGLGNIGQRSSAMGNVLGSWEDTSAGNADQSEEGDELYG